LLVEVVCWLCPQKKQRDSEVSTVDFIIVLGTNLNEYTSLKKRCQSVLASCGRRDVQTANNSSTTAPIDF